MPRETLRTSESPPAGAIVSRMSARYRCISGAMLVPSENKGNETRRAFAARETPLGGDLKRD